MRISVKDQALQCNVAVALLMLGVVAVPLTGVAAPFESTTGDEERLVEVITKLRALRRQSYTHRDPEFAALVEQNAALVSRNVDFLLPRVEAGLKEAASRWPECDHADETTAILFLLRGAVKTREGALAVGRLLPQVGDAYLRMKMIGLLSMSKQSLALDAIVEQLEDETPVPRLFGPPRGWAGPRIKDYACEGAVDLLSELDLSSQLPSPLVKKVRHGLDVLSCEERDREISGLRTWLAQNPDLLDRKPSPDGQEPREPAVPEVPPKTGALESAREPTADQPQPTSTAEPLVAGRPKGERPEDDCAGTGLSWAHIALALAGTAALVVAVVWLLRRRKRSRHRAK